MLRDLQHLPGGKRVAHTLAVSTSNQLRRDIAVFAGDGVERVTCYHSIRCGVSFQSCIAGKMIARLGDFQVIADWYLRIQGQPIDVSNSYWLTSNRRAMQKGNSPFCRE